MSQRPTIAAANWKMHKTVAEATEFVTSLAVDRSDVTVKLYVPYLSLAAASAAANTVQIGAQNFYPEPHGAFTGEISLPMLQAEKITTVLVGHSERRHVFGEDDSLIQRKTAAAIDAGFDVCLCVGETQEQRESNQTAAILQHQVKSALENLGAVPDSFSVAYEPVWAIGTGLTATPEIAQEAHEVVRAALRDVVGAAADRIPILYGGSVKPANAAELSAQADIDGVLVGGASLELESWCAIINAL